MEVRGRCIRVVIVALGLLLPAAGAATTHHVTPADDLGVILSAAAAGDTVALACGVYRQDGLVVANDVVIRGQDEDPGCVVLESSGQASVFTCTNASRQLQFAHLTFTTALDAVLAPDVRGAALNLSGSSPVITGCRFNGLWAAHGGAVYCADGSAPVIVNCRFEANEAVVAGGAIMCAGASNAMVAVSLFRGNVAAGSGGAIHAAMGSHLSVLSCTFVGNGGVAGSSLSAWDQSVISVRSSIIVEGVTSPGWIGDIGSVPLVTCSDVFGNDGGDWVGLLAGQAAAVGNLAADPLFCPAPGLAAPFALDAASPCAAPAGGCGAYLGAFAVGCGAGTPAGTPPAATRLLGNRPNPFNPGTVIHFELAQAGAVSLDVFDVGGRRLRQLVAGPLAAGAHTAGWDGRDASGRPVAAGVYFYRLQTAEAQDIGSMVLVK